VDYVDKKEVLVCVLQSYDIYIAYILFVISFANIGTCHKNHAFTVSDLSDEFSYVKSEGLEI
jgi:hypothetical protein